jgi:hypothetical protein
LVGVKNGSGVMDGVAETEIVVEGTDVVGSANPIVGDVTGVAKSTEVE